MKSITKLIYSASAVVILLTGVLTPVHALAQVRLIDRIGQPGPSVPSISESVAQVQENLQRGSVHIDRHVHKRQFPASNQDLTLPHWSSSFNHQNTTYPFTVLGSDPALGRTTVIPTVIIPYRLIFADGHILDASTDLIDGITPLNGILTSPIFQSVPWQLGGTNVGTTQFGDAFMRANFWVRHSDAGNGYHLLLGTPSVAPLQVIQVPADQGQVIPDPVSGEPIGVVFLPWLDDQLVQSMVALGVSPGTLPIHLFSSTIAAFYNGGSFLGFHDALDLSPITGVPGIQTLIMSGYYSSHGVFPTSANSAVVGHEVLEWLNDPLLGNIVPAWQDPGRPHVCDQALMEVADPLDTLPRFQVTLNGRDYTLEDAAFFPWFARINARFSVNGWLSFRNTFTSVSESCPVFDLYFYLFIDIVGADATIFTSINNANQLVSYAVFGNAAASFLFQIDPDQGLIFLDVIQFPGTPFATIPFKINDRGDVVGIFFDAFGGEHGFLRRNGAYTAIDFPGAVATEALGINSRNNTQIVGDYTDLAGFVHGFILDANQFSTIDAPFATNFAVTAINDSQQMVGTYNSGGLIGGWAGNRGMIAPLNYPGGPGIGTSLNSLNRAGRAVGEAVIPQFGLHRAIYTQDGNFQDAGLGVFVVNSTLFGNNDANWAVGTAQEPSLQHGLIAIPYTVLAGFPFARAQARLP